MARNIEPVGDVVEWIHPLDRVIEDVKKPSEWTCEDDALAFDLIPLTGVDFMRLERLRGQLTKEDINIMDRAQKTARDLIEKYVKRVYHYSIPITTGGRKQAQELFGLAFPSDQERFKPTSGKELWIACAIAPGMEYQTVLDPVILALQKSSVLADGIRKKSLLQSDSSSAEKVRPESGAAVSADELRPALPISTRSAGENFVTATALRMTS